MITKDNFLLKKSQQEVFEELTDEEAGKLIKGIFNYVSTGDSGLSGVLSAVFIPIKKDIDDNEAKYQAICERNRQNGLNGGRPRKPEEITQENPMGYSGIEEKTEETQVDILGQNTHISYITNHNSNIHNNQNNHLEDIKEIIEYLNKITNSRFKYSSKATQTKINARLNEGYKIEDFLTVIDKKSEEWIGTEWEKYLCPETLFGTKFEKYLNQKTTNKPKTLKDISMSDLDRAIELEKRGRQYSD